MPPKKPSASRQSNTSTARFALMEDVAPTEPTPAPPATAPVVEASTSEPPSEKKQESSKPKETEKKKKEDHDDPVTIEDLALPKSIITRLAKGVLPPNTQIQANAILALSNSATVFINYLASHANENTVNAGKKTIAPADVFKALDDTEFSFLRAPLEAEFAKFHAIQTGKRTSYRQKVRAKKSDDPDASMADVSQADTTINSEASGPRAKKARVDPSAAAEDEVVDDAETEDEEPVEDEDEAGEEEEEEEEEDEDDQRHSGDETQDALEEREGEEVDEALDGDDSD